jgi:hypothetical protein
MRAKMNRYDLSLWDMRKRQLYGRERESVQAATLAVVGYSNFVIPSAFFLARGNLLFPAADHERPPSK